MTNASSPPASAPGQTAIVLVHGGFVDGSGWEGVYLALREDGYDVSVVQNFQLPTTLNREAIAD